MLKKFLKNEWFLIVYSLNKYKLTLFYNKGRYCRITFFFLNCPIIYRVPLSSTTSSVQHQKPFSSTYWRFLLLNWGVCLTEGCVKVRSVLNWVGCGTEGGVEVMGVLNWEVCWSQECVDLRGCGTEGGVELRGVLNWGVFGVKLRDFGCWKGAALLCWTDVLNWGGP